MDTLAYDNLLRLLAKDSLVQMIQTVIIFIISPHCNRDLEDRNPSFLCVHNTTVHDDAPP